MERRRGVEVGGVGTELVTRCTTSSDLKIVLDKKAAIVVGFKPVVQMNLVQIRCDDFLTEFVGLCAQERNVHSGEDSDQRLQNAVGVGAGMSIRRLHLAERGWDYQEPMREGTHEPEPIDKRRTIHREGMNQVREILPLNGADVLQSGDGVIWSSRPNLLLI
jgi:hypothetical protein